MFGRIYGQTQVNNGLVDGCVEREVRPCCACWLLFNKWVLMVSRHDVDHRERGGSGGSNYKTISNIHFLGPLL